MISHGKGAAVDWSNFPSPMNANSTPTGDVLGKVGRTGKVTGAHLHWSVSLNDARGDPNLLVQ
jgi:hypothetical protein